MAIELTLKFRDHLGRERRVVTSSESVTLGRDAANDVVIDDANLSRQHAVIENGRGSIQLSDCNSRNGTSVNGHPLVGAVELCDGDVINLGGSCDLSVAIQRVSNSSNPVRFSVPAIAGAAVAIILVAAGLLLALSVWRERPTSSGNVRITGERGKNHNQEVPASTPTIPRTDTGGDVALKSPDDGADQIGRSVKRVMSKLSNDNASYISNAGIEDVNRKVEEYRGSAALAEKLRAAKEGCSEIAAQAQRIRLRPALVMYAALAESEPDAGGNPIASARRMTPRLLTLRATFGTETANSSLLLIAAYPYPFNPPIGSQTRTPHPLASKLVEFGGRRSTVDTSEARSVWFLREKNGITDEAYNMVIRLLAIGIIAQSPQQYGIEAEPLLC